jgi:hypothetical protein
VATNPSRPLLQGQHVLQILLLLPDDDKLICRQTTTFTPKSHISSHALVLVHDDDDDDDASTCTRPLCFTRRTVTLLHLRDMQVSTVFFFCTTNKQTNDVALSSFQAPRRHIVQKKQQDGSRPIQGYFYALHAKDSKVKNYRASQIDIARND